MDQNSASPKLGKCLISADSMAFVFIIVIRLIENDEVAIFPWMLLYMGEHRKSPDPIQETAGWLYRKHRVFSVAMAITCNSNSTPFHPPRTRRNFRLPLGLDQLINHGREPQTEHAASARMRSHIAP
jgi:hypothetical protein